MADNLKIQQQINEAIKQRNVLFLQSEESISRQAKLYSGLLDVITGKKSSEALDEMISKLDDSRKKMQDMADEAEKSFSKLDGSLDKSTEKADKFVKSSETLSEKLKSDFPIAFGAAVGAASGFWKGLKDIGAISKFAVGTLTGLAGSIWNIGKSILATPLRIFQGLFDMAQQGGSNELLVAFENIRKEFGSFKQDVAKNVVHAATSMRGELANTGISVWRVFGNLAERLKYFTELAKQMGPVMHVVGKEIADNAEQFAAFQKGLGIAGEEMKFVAQRAVATGQSLMELSTEIGSMSLQMADDFGLSAKMVSRDVGKMLKDVKNFGSLSIKEMTQVSVFTQKLGIGFDKLLGTIQKFDMFEDAATNAAKLSQTFGVQIDAVEIMKEQDPARRLDMLRKSFAQAGVTVDKFGRQEMAAIEAMTGLDAEAAKVALSSKTLGLNYDAVAKSGEAAKKSQMSQEQVLKRLGDAIERVFPSGSSKFEGFFDAFGKGILAGIGSSREWIRLMMNIRQSIWEVYQVGVKFGRWIVEAFPGVEKMISGIADLFSPGKISGLFNKITQEFQTFITGLSTGKVSFSELMKNIQKHFFSFFSSEEPGGKKFLDGMKDFFKTFSKIAAEGLKWVIEQLKDGLKKGVEFFKNPAKFLEDLKKGGEASGAGGFLMDIFGPLIDALGDKKMWDELADAALDFLSAAWEYIKPKLLDMVKKLPFSFWATAGAILFGPAVIRAAFGAVTSVVVTKATQAFTGMMGNIMDKVSKSAGAGKTGEAAEAAKKADEATNALPKPGFGKRVREFIEEIGQIKIKDLLKAGAIIAGLTVFVGGAMLGFAYALGLVVKSYGKDVKVEEVVTLMGGLTKILLAAAGTVAIVSIVGKIAGPGALKNVMVGLIPVGVVIAAMALTAWAVVSALKGTDPGQMASIAKVLEAVGGMFLAASAVVVVAMATGAILIAAGGLLGAGLVLAGLAVIGVVVGAIALTALGLVKTLGGIPAGRELESKADIFLKLVEAIGSMAKTMAVVMVAAAFSTSEASKAGPEATSKANQLTQVLNDFIGSEQSQTGLLGLITQVLNITQHLPTGEVIVKQTSIMTNIMGAITSLADTMTPKFTATDNAMDKLMKVVDPAHDTLNDVANATKRLMGQVQVFIDDVVTKFTSKEFQAKFSNEAIKSIENVKGVIDIIGTVTKVFSDVKNAKGEKEIDAVSFSSPIKAIKSLLDDGSGKSPITEIISSLNLANSAAKGFDPKSLSSLETVLKTIDHVKKVLSTGNVKKEDEVSGGLQGLIIGLKLLGNLPKDIGEIDFKSAGTKLKTISDGLTQSFDEGTVKKLTSTLGVFAGLAGVEKGIKNIESLNNLIQTISSLATRIDNTTKDDIGGSFAKIQSIVMKANEMTKAVQDLARTPVEIKAALTKMSNAAGLGAAKEYRITSDKVVISVNLNVTMEAGKVEEVIIQRSDSSIRKAFNSTSTTDSGKTLANEHISGTPKYG